MSRLLVATLAAASLVACGNTQTGLQVVISGEAVPGTDFDQLELHATFLDGSDVTRQSVSASEMRGLPFRLNIVSAGKILPGTRVGVSATATLDGGVTWTANGDAPFDRGVGGSLELTLQRGSTPAPIPPCTEDAGCAVACDGGLPCPPPSTETAKGKPGDACMATSDCSEGTCSAEGICCRTGCSDPCGRCLPGTGDCAPKPAGSVVAACNAYVCNGTSKACPMICERHADCLAPDHGCRDAQCVARLGAFQDDFEADSLSTRWQRLVVQGGFTAAVRDGKLELSTVRNVAGDITIGTDANYDGRETSIGLEVVSPPASTAVALNFGFQRISPGFALLFNIEKGNLAALNAREGAAGQPWNAYLYALRTFDPVKMRFLRLKTQGGRTLFQFSPDGVNFETLHDMPDGFDYSRTQLFIELLSSNALSSVFTCTVDNLNAH